MFFERSEVVKPASTNMLSDDSLITVGDEHHVDWSLLTEDKQQIAALNATEQEYPTDACVQQIARQATATSDAVALVANGQALSYHKLNWCANQVVHYLNVHADTPLSIDRAIANTQIYILDEYLQQVSIGEPGELYIGGVGLAKGYLNRRTGGNNNDSAHGIVTHNKQTRRSSVPGTRSRELAGKPGLSGA